MRVLYLSNHSTCCDYFRGSLECAGAEVSTAQWDAPRRRWEIINIALHVQPDFVVYIGRTDVHMHHDELRRIRKEVAPTVHLCGDGSLQAWWPHLETYEREECFSCQVNFDGSQNTPIAGFENGLVALAPTDARPFVQRRAWSERPVLCSFVGNTTREPETPKSRLLYELQRRGAVALYGSESGRTYAQMANIMCDSRVTLNVAWNGHDPDTYCVKNRVVEAGMAGAVLVEQRGSPASKWFEPGVDYLEFDGPDEACEWITWVLEHGRGVMAHRFRERVMKEHGPQAFWKKVAGKIGVAM